MTLIIYTVSDNEIIHAVPSCSADQFESVCLMMGINPLEHRSLAVSGTYSTRQAKEGFSIVDDFAVKQVETVSEAQNKALKIVARSYAKICLGKDPVTGKDIYVDCVTDIGTFRMNAGETAAKTMDNGYTGFLSMGLSTMPYIRDFYNENHYEIPWNVAKQVRDKQFYDGTIYYAAKGAMVDAINAATTVEEVQAINTNFSVNVE